MNYTLINAEFSINMKIKKISKKGYIPMKGIYRKYGIDIHVRYSPL